MSSRKYTIPVLVLLFALVGLCAVAPTFAWAKCTVTLSPSTQSTTIPGGTTVTLTYLLTYSESSYYAAYFTLTAQSSNSAWTVVSISPSPIPGTGTSYSIGASPPATTSGLFSVEVTAPTTVGSTTTLTVKAANSGDSGANCQSSGTLLTAAPPPTGVPMFPLGMGILMALAIPALLLARHKFAGTPKL